MYMILAAQFESFVHPITILLALPLTMPVRAPLADPAADESRHLRHVRAVHAVRHREEERHLAGRLHQRAAGSRASPRDEAILEANQTRLRPILMTTVMLVAAMVPMALGQGPGARPRASMAKVILGGQSLSLLLTLLVTPVAYSLWDDFTKLWRRLIERIFPGRVKSANVASAPV